jgi:hypothetical protein
VAATLLQLRTRAYRRADKEGDPHVGTSEATDLVNEGWFELWELVQRACERWFESSTTFTLASGASSVAVTTVVPAGIYKAFDLQFYGSGQAYGTPLLRGIPAERPYSDDMAWDLRGSTIYVVPEDAAAGTYRLTYAPAFVPLSADGDALPTSLPTGWDRYVVNYAAMEMLGKEHSDTTRIERQQAQLRADIRAAAESRIAGAGRRVADVRGTGRFLYMTRSRWRD